MGTGFWLGDNEGVRLGPTHSSHHSVWPHTCICGHAAAVCRLQAVAVVQRAMRGQTPEAVMAELGFGPLLLIKAFPVNMSGAFV